MIASKHRQKGTSLVEASVSLSLLLASLLAYVKLDRDIYAANRIAEQRTHATHLLSEKLEHLRQPGSAPDAGSQVETYYTTTYQIAWSTAETAEGARAQVKIEWSDTDTGVNEIALSAYLPPLAGDITLKPRPVAKVLLPE